MLDYRTYRPADRWSHYDNEVAPNVAKWFKHQQVQLRLRIFHSFNPLSILSFLFGLNVTYDRDGVQDESVLWLLQYFMKRPAPAALIACIALKLKSHTRQKDGTITLYNEAVNYLLETTPPKIKLQK